MFSAKKLQRLCCEVSFFRTLKPEGHLYKLRPIITLLALGAVIAFSSIIGMAQPCPEPTIITIGNATAEPCQPQRLNVPVYISNPCAVGGFSIKISTTDPTWLNFTPGDPFAADTFGSVISNWESFTATVRTSSPYQVTVTGIADMPGGRDSVFLPATYGGLLFTIHLDFSNYFVCDTSQLLNFAGCQVSDTTGYNLFDLTLVRDSIYILPGNCSNNPRGDANCNGVANGIDVVYLVAYFKGFQLPPCCLCSGDVNHNGVINGVDVTRFVGYLKGSMPPLDPCN